jgi:predicted nucleotidyltransferase
MELKSDVQQELVCALRDRPEILFAILYGSAAEERPFRDLDIALFVDRAAVPPTADLDYAFTLADELEKAVPHAVDVRVINDAPLPFRYQVSRGFALIIHDRSALVRFLERTWDLFLDFQPVAMQYLKEQI